jgi:two-component system cell cycle sensor histidine kinase/response regulator CckA
MRPVAEILREAGLAAGESLDLASVLEVLQRLDARATAAREEAERLGAATRALSATLELGEVFDRILSELHALIPYDSAAVMELKDGRLEIIGGHGFANLPDLLGLGFDVDADNPNRDVVRSRAPVIVDDAPARYPAFRAGAHAATPIRSWLGVPLLFGDRLIGMLSVDKREPGFFGAEHARLAASFAAQAAIALENARLYASVERELAAAIRDVTERKRAEEALLRSEERFEKAFRANPAAMSMSTFPEGRVLDVNERFLAMTGYRRDEVLGRTLAELRFWEGGEGPPAASVSEMPFRYRTKTGEIREAVGSFERIEVLDGPCVLTLAEDLTHRRQLEAQLRQSQKMEAVGRLAGGIAHDFNNLLTAILGYSDLVLKRGEPALLAEVVEIQKAGERAASLTRQLLAFSRQQILQPKVLDLGAVVERVKGLLQRVIGEDVELVTEAAPGLGRVKADPAQIEQVLVNLAVNSRDAMPRGGTLTIATANLDLPRGDDAGQLAMRPGPYVVLSVADTGCGMDAPTLGRVFEPFFTTKAEGKGTGLGLSTVYGIVKQSDGYVFATSEPQRGTTFHIYLPRLQGDAAPSRPSLAAVESPRGTETVLLVEDQEMVRKLVLQVLEMNGYTVLATAGGAEAIELAARHAGPIHAILTDVVMPEMSGRDVADRIAALRPGLRVLYMSGYSDDVVTRHGVLDEGVAFLQKPFGPDALARKLRDLLDATLP